MLNSNCNTLNNTCINIAGNIDWVYNNFKDLESVFTVAIGGYNQQPILECLQNHYNELPCEKFILGFMTVGPIHMFIGYKINDGDYCSFLFFGYANFIVEISKSLDEWRVENYAQSTDSSPA